MSKKMSQLVLIRQRRFRTYRAGHFMPPSEPEMEPGNSNP